MKMYPRMLTSDPCIEIHESECVKILRYLCCVCPRIESAKCKHVVNHCSGELWPDLMWINAG